MTWHRWVAFLAVAGLSALSPGPAVLFVLSNGLSWGRRAALWAASGILAANVLFFSLSGLGLGAVLLASPRLFTIARLAGAAYLAYLGLKSFGAGSAAPASSAAVAVDATGWTILTRASALQLANPHALIFFVALVPQFIDATKPIASQLALLTITALAIELVILGSYGSFAARASHFAREPRIATRINRASGALLIAAAVWLAFP